jgi:hypothetical protein
MDFARLCAGTEDMLVVQECFALPGQSQQAGVSASSWKKFLRGCSGVLAQAFMATNSQPRTKTKITDFLGENRFHGLPSAFFTGKFRGNKIVTTINLP